MTESAPIDPVSVGVLINPIGVRSESQWSALDWLIVAILASEAVAHLLAIDCNLAIHGEVLDQRVQLSFGNGRLSILDRRSDRALQGFDLARPCSGAFLQVVQHDGVVVGFCLG